MKVRTSARLLSVPRLSRSVRLPWRNAVPLAQFVELVNINTVAREDAIGPFDDHTLAVVLQYRFGQIFRDLATRLLWSGVGGGPVGF